MALTARTVPLCAPTAAAATVTSSLGAAFAALVSTGLSECPGTWKGLGGMYPTLGAAVRPQGLTRWDQAGLSAPWPLTPIRE
jgi:hypothetical protein